MEGVKKDELIYDYKESPLKEKQAELNRLRLEKEEIGEKGGVFSPKKQERLEELIKEEAEAKERKLSGEYIGELPVEEAEELKRLEIEQIESRDWTPVKQERLLELRLKKDVEAKEKLIWKRN